MYKFHLLKAKHWQLFLFFYGLPLFYQIVLIGGIVSNTIENNKPNIDTVLEYSKFSSLIIMAPILILLFWFWSVGVVLNNSLPRELKLQTSKFKVFIIFIALYFITISICIWMLMNSWGSDDINLHKYVGDKTIFSILGLFFLLSIFVIFCLFFSFYFVAKTLKTAELEEKVNFSDYVGEFLLIWLFPIGIWFIQPRINKLVKE